jgi:hypothetical protein
MFTVKVRFASGNENIFEARRVEWLEKDMDNGHPYKAGLLIHYEDGSFTHYAPDDNNIQVWVMNRHGATVSHYRF